MAWNITDRITDIASDKIADGIVSKYQGKVISSYYASLPFSEVPVSFEANDRTVYGTLCLPTEMKTDVPAVVMLHGTGSARDEAGDGFKYCAPLLASCGIASLRIDLIGCGESKVDYQYYNYTTATEDAVAAKDYLKGLKEIDGNRIGVMGWSQGGTDALLAAAADKEFKSVCLWAGALDMQMMYTPEMRAEAKKNGFAVMDLGWRSPLNLGWKWIEEVEGTDMRAVVKKVSAPIFAINGENDDVVDPASGNEIARIASNSLSTYIVIPGADHTFGVFTDPDFNALGETIANTMQWFATTL